MTDKGADNDSVEFNEIDETNLVLFPNIQGKCRSCGSPTYTIAELNVMPDQNFRCYYCYDKEKHGGKSNA